MQPLANRALLQRPRATITSSSVVCRSCRRRRLATTAAPPKPPAAGLAELSSRRVLAVAGADATKFLQGIVTQNVATANSGRNITTAPPEPRTEGFYAGFLNATGRVMHDTFIYPFRSGAGGLSALDYGDGGDGFLVEADASQAARLEKYIKRYKLRAKVSVRVLAPEEVSVWQAWDDAASNPGLPSGNGSIMTLRDPRAPAMGWRILQLGPGTPDVIDAERAAEDAYTIRRYLQGVPEGQDELLREQALPLESNMEHMGGVDFHKGCYVGQELTIRTRHRGVVRKRVLPCALYDADRPAPSVLAYDPDALPAGSGTTDAAAVPTETSIGRCGKSGRSAGKWLKGLGNVGLALCRLEIMTDVAAVVPGGGDQVPAAATYSPEDDFVLDWGGDDDVGGSVKIKAFVPDWLRASMEEAQRKKKQ
ncbi:aminomethyl transferase [Cordyceps fumosorosea ARSEF 2679]|uniref:Iron-sulfur cluster assembly factor IBA57 homolog, mitochondrial n=1 Tax=Cordyceps fumosorosea (strain ARSEF 2679) TaxID=1081104 RepID=A0A167ZE61_CORFA|nr:aminomethyl transferase [Cordyceps fumosorosea ARSEF 2679]OAA67400.1 aminomethyl transferase [Cordyceps fumosorosea ARSEF 2679]